MNTRPLLVSLSAASLIAIGACGRDDLAALRRASTTPPVLQPLPAKWTGSRADLIVAEAVIGCSYGAGATKPAIIHPEYFEDKYMLYLLDERMSVLEGNNNAGAPPYYPDHAACIAYSNGQSCLDITPLLGNGSDGSPYIQPAAMPELPAGEVGLALGAPQFNLCVAQRLRDYSPGGAVSEALLMPAADQLQLLEVARERAQTAMLQYAALTAAFAPRSAPDAATQATSVTWQLRKWAEANPSAVAAMGRDFATAVQYEITLAGELVSLFASNATGHVPTGALATASGADRWGENSWRERAMSVLYGGDPLRGETGHRPPWIHESSVSWTRTNDASHAELDGSRWQPATDWPSRYDEGFVGTSTPDPHVVLLEQLARQADALSLYVPTRPKAPLSSADQQLLFAACVDNHYYVDRGKTAEQLYRNVEAMLREASCAAAGSGCDATPAAKLPSPADNFGSYLAYSQYGITFDHALQLAARLDDQVANLCPYADDQALLSKYDSRKRDLNFILYGIGAGAMDVAGAVTLLPSVNGVDGTWWHLSPDSVLVPRRLEELEPLYTLQAPFRVPTQAFDAAAPWQQQIAPASSWPDARRTLGAVPALQATREAIVAGLVGGSDPVLAQYQALAREALGAIAGAIGEQGVSVMAAPTLQGTELTQLHAKDAAGSDDYAWTVAVEIPSTDGWFDPQHPEQYTLVATSSPIAGPLLLNPGSSTFASSDPFSLPNVVGQTVPMQWSAGVQAVRGGASSPAGVSRWDFALSAPYWNPLTLVVERTTSTGTEYRVLATNLRLAPTTSLRYSPSYVSTDRPFEGQYFAYGGSLNARARQLMATQRDNPALPAYDGLGLPLDLVPVSDPTLIGGNAGENPISIYIARAEKAADDAATAVKSQLDDLFTVAHDDQARHVAAQNSDGLIALERQGLCGKAQSCDLGLFDYDMHLESAWLSAHAAPPDCSSVDASDYQKRSDCAFYGLLQAMNVELALPTPVVNHIADPTPPQFSEYDGGTLQTALIDEWSAARAVRNGARGLAASAAAAYGRVDEAQAALQSASDRAKQNCSQDALAQAAAAGVSVSYGTSVSSDSKGGVTSVSHSQSESFNSGPLVSQIQRCQDVLLDVTPAQKQAIAAYLDAMLEASSEASKLGDAERVLSEAAAHVQYLAAQTRLAVARDELQRKIAEADPSLKTNFGLFNILGSNAVWTARATVDNARRQAVLARRAIEARYVVDLSQLTANEPLVVAPALWADQVYAYDLDAPAALGLDVNGTSATQIYPYGLQTYTKNLELFVTGFAQARPTAVTKPDSSLLTLPPPVPDPTAPASGTVWVFYCPGSGGDGTWVPMPSSGNLADACGTGVAPVRARTSFTLDAWGRLAGVSVGAPTNVYNARFTQLAVNLTGTSARDCSATPQDCEYYVPYRLVHNGPAYTTAYDRSEKTLALPVGVIDGAKAVAKEKVMDIYSWTTSPDSELLATVARSEFVDRPLGGTYTLELNPYQEQNIRLDYITGVQVLYQAGAWVRQTEPTLRRPQPSQPAR